jgi:hypothetical protein
LITRILAKRPSPVIEARAKNKLAYLKARLEAQERFNASDFAAAAKLYELALSLDPFSIDAAFGGANSYLLNDQIGESFRLFQAVRLRGASISIGKADSMLKELAPVYPEAGQELQKGLPQPPPIEEMFGDVRFGVPDFDSGKQYLEANPIDLARSSKQLMNDHPMPVAPPPPALTTPLDTAPSAPSQLLLASLHVEVSSASATRDLTIRKLAQPGGDEGFVQLEGLSAEATVLVEGKPVSAKGRLTLPAGKYEVRLVENGKTLGTQTVEVKALSTIVVPVSRQIP